MIALFNYDLKYLILSDNLDKKIDPLSDGLLLILYMGLLSGPMYQKEYWLSVVTLLILTPILYAQKTFKRVFRSKVRSSFYVFSTVLLTYISWKASDINALIQLWLGCYLFCSLYIGVRLVNLARREGAAGYDDDTIW